MLIVEPRSSSGQDAVTTISDINYPFVVSTRNHFNTETGEMLKEHTSTDYPIQAVGT
jgi:hypothetical protein